MGKKGKSEWDEAMEATGHRITTEKTKKWASRLRTNTKNGNVVDAITKEQGWLSWCFSILDFK